MKGMIEAGMNVARVNGAFADTEELDKVAKLVRDVSDDVALMVDVKGSEEEIGGLVGIGFNVINSHATGAVEGDDRVGGLIGYFNWAWGGSTVKNSYATGSVEGGTNVGGLIGRTPYFIMVEDSYSTAWRVQGDSRVGGLVGSTGTRTYGIDNSYSTAWVRGGRDVGGLVGSADGDTRPDIIIKNSYATGDVDDWSDASVTERRNFGGLVGFLHSYEIIKNSYATGDVDGWMYAGGLVGHNRQAYIKSSYATGDVFATQWAGGLVGLSEYDWMDPKIENSYATGNVSGYDFFGGLVGENQRESWTSSTIKYSYSTGKVECGVADEDFCTDWGGLVGTGVGAQRSYWNTETSGKENSSTGSDRTTSDMTWPYVRDSLSDTYYTWDMEEIWTDWDHTIVEDHEGNTGYPALRWQTE